MATQIPLEPSLSTGTSKWEHLVKAENGKIYGIPNRATRVLKICPSTQVIGACVGPTFSEMPYKWGRGAEIDGIIYCPPASERTILRIDTHTDEVSEVPCNIDVDQTAITDRDEDYMARPVKWYAAVKANGVLYCPPMGADKVLCIEVAGGVARSSLIGRRQMYGRRAKATGRHSFGWACGVLASNGMIYCPPCDATKVLMINPITNNVSMVGQDLGVRKFKWCDAIKALGDGYIYAPPCVDGKVLRIRPGVDGQSCICDRMCSGPDLSERKKRGWGAGVLYDGYIYCPPRRDSQVLKICPEENTCELVGPTLSKMNGSKWCGAAEVMGYIYCVPCDANSILGFVPRTIDPLGHASGSFMRPLPQDPAQRRNNPDIRLRKLVAKHYREFRRNYCMSWDHWATQQCVSMINLTIKNSELAEQLKDRTLDYVCREKSGDLSIDGDSAKNNKTNSNVSSASDTTPSETVGSDKSDIGTNDDGRSDLHSQVADLMSEPDCEPLDDAELAKMQTMDSLQVEITAANLISATWQKYADLLSTKEEELSQQIDVEANQARRMQDPDAMRRQARQNKRRKKKELNELRKQQGDQINKLVNRLAPYTTKLNSKSQSAHEALQVVKNPADMLEKPLGWTDISSPVKGKGKHGECMAGIPLTSLKDRFVKKLDAMLGGDGNSTSSKGKGKTGQCFEGLTANLPVITNRPRAPTKAVPTTKEMLMDMDMESFKPVKSYGAGLSLEPEPEMEKCTVCDRDLASNKQGSACQQM